MAIGWSANDVKGKTVFVRVDINAPLDCTRFRVAVPAIKSLQSDGAKVILLIYLGCPKGDSSEYILKSIVPRLSELLGVQVKMANDCIGEEIEKLVAETAEGGVLLIERFHVEEKNDPEVTEKLNSLADFYMDVASIIAYMGGALKKEMAAKRSLTSLKQADLKGKRVFLRVDFNVPLDDNFNITDDTRIRAAVPTIDVLQRYGAKVILCTHLGRPKGFTPKYSLKPIVPRLSELLQVQVKMANDCIGEEVEKLVAETPEGGVLLLENVRFHKEEEKNDPEFSKKLASLADLYVNDAFGTAHRAHASTEGVAEFLKPAVSGFLMQKELKNLGRAVSKPSRPFAAIVGGSKVSSKIGVIESLLEDVNFLLLGGGMIFTFYRAQGYSVGSSLLEEDKLDLATTLIKKAKEKGVRLLLPTDVVIADKFAADANSKVVPASAIPDDWMGLDIGPDSIKTFNQVLDVTQTVIWNGPMGMFPFKKFGAGTEAIAKKLAELWAKGMTTIVGGGNTVAAVKKLGLADYMTYISTGGGASLEFLAGQPLPGVLVLDNA